MAPNRKISRQQVPYNQNFRQENKNSLSKTTRQNSTNPARLNLQKQPVFKAIEFNWEPCRTPSIKEPKVAKV